jgi:hypothetical protein
MGLVTATVDMDKVNIATQKADIAFQKHTETVNKFGEGSIEAAKTALALEQAENRLAAAVDGTNDKLSASAKTLATQALIMEATKDAQGDFARTSDGLANSQRILTAQVKDLQAELGAVLLPIVEAGVKLLSQFTGAMAANKDIVIIAISVIGGLAAAIVAANVAMKVYQATLVAVKVAQPTRSAWSSLPLPRLSPRSWCWKRSSASFQAQCSSWANSSTSGSSTR